MASPNFGFPGCVWEGIRPHAPPSLHADARPLSQVCRSADGAVRQRAWGRFPSHPKGYTSALLLMDEERFEALLDPATMPLRYAKPSGWERNWPKRTAGESTSRAGCSARRSRPSCRSRAILPGVGIEPRARDDKRATPFRPRGPYLFEPGRGRSHGSKDVLPVLVRTSTVVDSRGRLSPGAARPSQEQSPSPARSRGGGVFVPRHRSRRRTDACVVSQGS
jgi:hypothetical protein